MAKTQSPAASAAAAPDTIPTLAVSRAYMVAAADEETGEVAEAPRFRYLPGHPRQIRFDAKAGVFNVNGKTVLGKTISLIPLALRIFRDDILNMGPKTWAELFFIDQSGAVCAVLFHGYSVENLQKLNAELFYDDLNLTDVVLTVEAIKKQTEKEGKQATYYIAEFSYTAAEPAEVQARQEFAYDFPIWREETTTDTAHTLLTKGYRLPEDHQPGHLAPRYEPAALPPVALAAEAPAAA